MQNVWQTVIVDSNTSFLKQTALQLRALGAEAEPLLFGNAKDAITYLGKHKPIVLNFYLGSSTGYPSLSDLLVHLKQMFPVSNFYINHEKTPFLDTQSATRFGVKLGTQNLNAFEFIKNKVSPVLKSLLLRDQSHTPHYIPDPQFIPIPILSLLHGENCGFDLFIQLPSGKFLKLIEANETLGNERLKSYYDKGIDCLFIKRENFLKNIDSLRFFARSILLKKDLPLEYRVTELMAKGQRTIEEIHFDLESKIKTGAEIRFGLKSVESSTDFIGEIYALLQRIENYSSSHLLKSQEDAAYAIQLMFKHIVLFDHAIGCSVIAAAYCKFMKFQSEELLHTIALSAFLQNVGLAGASPEVRNLMLNLDFSQGIPLEVIKKELDGETLNALNLYHLHPDRGAHILSTSEEVKEAVVQAVRMHHVRKDGSGFPQNISSNKITRVSEIIGLCDEYVSRVLVGSKKKYTDGASKMSIEEQMEKLVYRSFSSDIADSFRDFLKFIKKF